MAADLEAFLLVVPDVAVGEVVDELGRRGLVGWAVDGAELGHDGHVLALVGGDERDRLWIDTGDTIDAVSVDSFREQLHASWPGAEIDPERIAGHRPVGPSSASERLAAATVAVAPYEDLMLGVLSSSARVQLEQVRTADGYLVGMKQNEHVPDDMLSVVGGTARGTTVVLWRRGPLLGLGVHHKGDLRELHWWGPDWTPIGDPLHDELRSVLGTPRGDAAEIARLVGRDDDAVAIRALLRRPLPSAEEVVETLGLPAEAADVLAGRVRVADLPGGTVVEPTSTWKAVRAAASSTEHDPAWLQALDDGGRELRPWYLATSAASVLLGGVLIAESGGTTGFFGVVGLVLVGGVVVDLPVRWWLRRRRRARAD